MFSIRWRRPLFVLNDDLHRVPGIVAAPLLMVVIATGVPLTFHDAASRSP